MENQPWKVLAQAFQYPNRDLLGMIAPGVEEMSSSDVRKAYTKFVQRVKTLTQSEWEELYTRTLDLDPIVAPYVGYHIWGDSYQRGAFMALLNGAMQAAGVPANGELPDHLIPIMNYLGVAVQPLPDLTEVLPGAIERMVEKLRESDPDNAYNWLLDAVYKAVKSAPQAMREGAGET